MDNSGKITNTAFLRFHFAELLCAEHKKAELRTSHRLAAAAARALAMDVPTAGLGAGEGSCFLSPRMRTARSPWQPGKLISFQLFCNSSDLTNEWRKPTVETEGHICSRPASQTVGLMGPVAPATSERCPVRPATPEKLLEKETGCHTGAGQRRPRRTWTQQDSPATTPRQCSNTSPLAVSRTSQGRGTHRQIPEKQV